MKPSTDDIPHRAASVSSVLRVVLLEQLNRSLRGGLAVETSRLLSVVRDALRANQHEVALRNIDHAWRCLPEDAALLGPIYGRLLMLGERDYYAGLGLLQRANDLAPDPEVAALIAVALLRLQRPAEARQQLEEALATYCVIADDLLWCAAGEIMRHPAVDAPGWIGRTQSLALIGELSPECSSGLLHIHLEDCPVLPQILGTRPQRAEHRFSLRSPHRALDAPIEVRVRDRPLLGAKVRTPADFALDGRARIGDGQLAGWTRLGWLPSQPVRLRVEDGRRAREADASRREPSADWRWPYAIDLATAGIRGARILVSALLPDGRWHPLPDSPLLLEAAVRRTARVVSLPAWGSGTPAPAGRVRGRASRIDVVIPIHGRREESLACIDAVLASIDHSAQVVVVDDGTDDAALVEALEARAAAGHIRLLRNATNLGFVASVNHALSLNPSHDVVLLNSDTLVFDDWLARLRAAAYSGPTVGTATPLSNNGSIASYPRAQGAAIDPQDAALLHAFAASTHSGTRIEIPVGVGFCLYLRRDCLRDVGILDAEVFGKGYGEETDYCLRARGRGWSHQLAADVFVYHASGISFGKRRSALLDRSQRLLNLRYPGFDAFIAGFLAQEPLRVVRRSLDERRLLAFNGRFVLLVTHSLTGGVERFVAERCREVRARGLFPLLLKAAEAGNAGRCELSTDAIEAPNLRYDIPADLSELAALLRALSIEHIEIQHFLHLDARVIEAVRALPMPYDIFVHDYAWICPRVTLIDGTGRYCGEPAVSVCEACVSRLGSNLGEDLSVAALRARSAAWLRGARHVIVPSADTAARLQRHFEDLPVLVRPHGPAVVAAARSAPAPGREQVRVALIGAIGEHKGYRILRDCAEDARARGLPLEFVVIGYTEDDAPLLDTGKVFITGRYGEAEASHLLEREQPDLAWLPSVWPETWCYTLDHALAAGLTVVAFDLGAIAERLRATGRGDLLPLGLEAQAINDRLLSLAAHQRLAVAASAATPRSPSLDDLEAAAGAVAPDEPEESVFGAPIGERILPVQIGAHIRTLGDRTFAAVPWAGRVAPGLWIESFSVQPLQRFGAEDLEYKGLTEGGFETPWISDGGLCGTQGMALPLLGFALRFKPGPRTAGYDCEYSGYFQSGVAVGPLRNGTPCRSSVAGDPLEGIQVRLIERPGTAARPRRGAGAPVGSAAGAAKS